jgi:hypothetical protein
MGAWRHHKSFRGGALFFAGTLAEKILLEGVRTCFSKHAASSISDGSECRAQVSSKVSQLFCAWRTDAQALRDHDIAYTLMSPTETIKGTVTRSLTPRISSSTFAAPSKYMCK